MKGDIKGAGPLNPMDICPAGGRGSYNSCRRGSNSGCLPVCLHLCCQKQQSVVRAQIPGIWRTGFLGPPWLLHTVPETDDCPLCGWGGRWGMGSCYCAKSWHWPKVAIVYHPCLSQEVTSLLETPKSRVVVASGSFCPCNYCPGGETGSHLQVLPTLPSPQNLPDVYRKCIAWRIFHMYTHMWLQPEQGTEYFQHWEVSFLSPPSLYPQRQPLIWLCVQWFWASCQWNHTTWAVWLWLFFFFFPHSPSMIHLLGWVQQKWIPVQLAVITVAVIIHVQTVVDISAPASWFCV